MVYVFLANGFEEAEALVPVDCLRRAGIEVAIVGVGGEVIKGSRGVSVVADRTDAPLDDALEMIVLPGGQPGSDNLRSSGMVADAISFCAANGRRIAAICAAPYILGEAGVLIGKRATCFPGFEGRLTGATISGDPVVTDGLITTAKAAGFAIMFGIELVRALRGAAAADKALNEMCAKDD